MSISSMPSHSFTRRSFIKGAAVLTATGMLVGCTPSTNKMRSSDSPNAPEFVEDEIFSGVCRGNCAGGCFLDVHVRDGQVVRTTARDLPDTRYNRICSKGITHVGRIYSSRRLMYPMRRVGERGQGEFERISWDEAFNEIVSKWNEYTSQYGPESMAIQYGSGNYAICSGVGLGGAVSRFMNAVGCSYIPNNVDAAHGYMATKICTFGLYGAQNEPADFLNSDTIICWGANPSVSQPHVMHFILEAQKKGAKYIVIDTMFNANAAKADKFIAVNPSSDGALAFGILKILFDNNWIDEDFVRNHTSSPFLINQTTKKLVVMSDFGVAPTVKKDPATGEDAPYDPYAVYDEIAGGIVSVDDSTRAAYTAVADANGIPVTTVFDNLVNIASAYTAERVTELTGVSAEDLQMLAEEYAKTDKINTYAMFGDNHYINGHYNYWPIYAVSWMTGHVGNPGNACGFAECIPVTANLAGTLYADTEGNPLPGMGAEYIDNKINALLDTDTYGGWKVSENYDESVPASGNVDVNEDGTAATPLKGVYVMCSNPMTNHANHAYTEEWFKKLDFVVVADMNMTETAKYADILLPVAHWFEQEDLFTSYASHLYMLLQEKAIEPIGEAKPDYEIWKELANRLDHPALFGDMDPEDYIKLWIESDANAAMGITFDELMDKKAIKYMPTDDYISYPDGVFNTPTGRGMLYTDSPKPAYDIGQRIDYSKELAPYWEPSIEADVQSPIRQTYPFYLLSEHMRTRTHSQWWDVDYLKEYEPEPCVKMNPVDASEKGIKDGDTVRMFNGRGTVTMKAYTNAGLPRGMVASPRAWQAEEFIEGHFASLPTNEFNQVVANLSFNDVAVDIEKI